MKQIIREYLTDYSTPEEFHFKLPCPECGDLWESTPVRFSKAKEQPKSESKRLIRQILYQQEKEAAWEQAVAEAMYHFNICPFCKRLVCNDCFLICDDLDMCRSCAGKLQEAGEQVSFTGWMVG